MYRYSICPFSGTSGFGTAFHSIQVPSSYPNPPLKGVAARGRIPKRRRGQRGFACIASHMARQGLKVAVIWLLLVCCLHQSCTVSVSNLTKLEQLQCFVTPYRTYQQTDSPISLLSPLLTLPTTNSLSTNPIRLSNFRRTNCQRLAARATAEHCGARLFLLDLSDYLSIDAVCVAHPSRRHG